MSKRRLVYSLINLGLPLPTVAGGESEPLIFDFLADRAGPSLASKVMTGHESGVITIAMAEADDATRELKRLPLGGSRGGTTVDPAILSDGALKCAAYKTPFTASTM
jgi:hypothetical protein